MMMNQSNMVGLEDEADTNSTPSLSGASSIDLSKKKWCNSEIISKLKTGELKEVENSRSKKEFWKNFTVVVDSDGQNLHIARCKGCKSFLRFGTSSSVLSRHICGKQSAAANTPSISAYFAKQSGSISVATKSKFTKALAYFCAKDMRPFEVVKGLGFRKLIKEILEIGSIHGVIDVDNVLPDPTTISRNISIMATDMCKKLLEQVQPIFSKYGGAITIDFWSDDHHRNPYIAVTGHYIDHQWELKNVLFGVYAWDIDQRQTGEKIYEFLSEKLQQFGISIDDKIIFVTDEGSNLKKALENDSRLNCTAHVLNTAMKNVFDQEMKKPKELRGPEVQLLENCNALVSFIRQSRVRAQLSRAVIPDVDTRWHSKIDMVACILKLWNEIEDILSLRDFESNRNDLDLLLAIDRAMLGHLFQILEPLRRAILEVETSSRYPTSPLIVLVYQKLFTSFNSVADEEETP